LIRIILPGSANVRARTSIPRIAVSDGQRRNALLGKTARKGTRRHATVEKGRKKR